jgi:DNA-binding SARP family transcriptional activator
VEFRVLGPLQASQDGRIISLGGARQRGVLAILLLHANRVVSMDAIADGLWGEGSPASAANTQCRDTSRASEGCSQAETAS